MTGVTTGLDIFTDKRIYNTPLGASTYAKFKQACIDCGVFEVEL